MGGELSHLQNCLKMTLEDLTAHEKDAKMCTSAVTLMEVRHLEPDNNTQHSSKTGADSHIYMQRTKCISTSSPELAALPCQYSQRGRLSCTRCHCESLLLSKGYQPIGITGYVCKEKPHTVRTLVLLTNVHEQQHVHLACDESDTRCCPLFCHKCTLLCHWSCLKTQPNRLKMLIVFPLPTH